MLENSIHTKNVIQKGQYPRFEEAKFKVEYQAKIRKKEDRFGKTQQKWSDFEMKGSSFAP